MLSFVPLFITEKYSNKILSGHFYCTTLFLDIKGFTNITETLMSEGKEGAETLSTVINNIFDQIINAINENNGFVANFEGDAILAIFPSKNTLQAINSVIQIKELFEKYKRQKTRFGNFELSFRTGLSYGKVEWRIIGPNYYKTFFFAGTAVNNCIRAEKKASAGEVILDKSVMSLISKNVEAVEIDNGFFKLIAAERKETRTVINPNKAIAQTISNDFIPNSLLKSNLSGEFRNVVSVFISFTPPDNEELLKKFFETTISKVNDFDGYFNSISFGDKGNTIVVFFGAPVSHEDDAIRAIEFISSLHSEYKDKIKAGITLGTVYSGIVGNKNRYTYTCLGNMVNLAARFMVMTDFGDVWLNKDLANLIELKYDIKTIGFRKFKGISKPLPVYKLIGKKRHTQKSYKSIMLGRDNEINKLRKYISPIFRGEFAGIVYVYGESGIGKSRLVHEFIKTLGPTVNSIIMQTDNIIKKSLNPFVYALSNYFKQSKATYGKKKFETIYDKLIDDLTKSDNKRKSEIINELIRTKSVIGALLGFRWKNSLYENLDPKGKSENTKFALKEFFRALSILKPTVIILEDLHIIDMDSVNLFKFILKNIENAPVVFIVTSRFNDDGSKPTIEKDAEIRKKEIILKNLKSKTAKHLIKSYLGQSPDKDLLSLIAKKTEYNPFFMEQLILYLKQNDFLEIKNNIARLKKMKVNIPNSINAIITARIDRLNPELRDIIQLASVLGKVFESDILKEMAIFNSTSITNRSFLSYLKEGENEQIWAKSTKNRYTFRHSLLQETVYDMQLRKRLRKLHSIAGTIIENKYKNEKEYFSELAYHFEKAEKEEKAKTYIEKAGDFAKSTYHNEKALLFYNKLFNYSLSNSEKIKINLKKGDILELIGKWDDAQNCYSEALDTAKRINELSLIASSENRLGNLLKNKGDNDQAILLLEDAYKHYEKLKDKKGMGFVIDSLGVIYRKKGEYEKAKEYFERSLDIAQRLNNENLLTKVYGDIGTLFYYHTDYKEAIKYYNKSFKIAEKTGDKLGLQIIGNIGIIYEQMGNFEEAMKYYKKQLTIAEELGNKIRIGNALGNIGIIYGRKGNYKKATKYMKKQLEIAKELGEKQEISITLSNLGIIYGDQGNYKKAMNYFKKSMEILEYLGDPEGISIALENMATIYENFENYEKAEEYIDRAINIGRKLNNRYYLCSFLYRKANLCFINNNIENAREINDEALKIASEVNRRDVIFNSNLLKIKIKVLSDKEQGIKELQDMINDDKLEDEEIVSLYYELFKLTNESVYKDRAIELYKKLYKISPKYEYKKRKAQLLSS